MTLKWWEQEHVEEQVEHWKMQSCYLYQLICMHLVDSPHGKWQGWPNNCLWISGKILFSQNQAKCNQFVKKALNNCLVQLRKDSEWHRLTDSFPPPIYILCKNVAVIYPVTRVKLYEYICHLMRLPVYYWFCKSLL